mgnify:CR=1 FL=1
MKPLYYVSAWVIISCIAGCASSQAGEVYNRDQTRKTQNVQLGTVEFVKQVIKKREAGKEEKEEGISEESAWRLQNCNVQAQVRGICVRLVTKYFWKISFWRMRFSLVGLYSSGRKLLIIYQRDLSWAART